MITIFYRIITAFILATMVWIVFDEDDLELQLIGALVIIPLILRVLMIK